ncbi:MAG: TonB family protein [Candidatus Didemnitutus sp.]|nr:TonB family protein [Candidatus Didemnitutus sp.]
MIAPDIPAGSPVRSVRSSRGVAFSPEAPVGLCPSPGIWRYQGIARNRGNIVFGLLGSVGLHLFFFFGLEQEQIVVRAAPVQEIEIIQLVMPELEVEPPDVVETLTDEADEVPMVSVPQLADLPSAVTVSTFVQPLQFVPDVRANLGTSSITTIPVNIGRDRNLAKMGRIFELGQLDRQPAPIMQPSPVFPYALRKEVERAEVVIEFIVDSNGDVALPTVVSSTHRGFEEAALAGVSKWKFRPGTKSGRRVNTRVRVPINFILTDSD